MWLRIYLQRNILKAFLEVLDLTIACYHISRLNNITKITCLTLFRLGRGQFDPPPLALYKIHDCLATADCGSRRALL